ncbi:unnamed protein product [Staurois parvus]|uniref:Uncharacterized protein n=1 Tax=Staurois parvus TaxID=386267 RepID=A0ABN9CWK1_9NEOB|nr:unnamed protein product [Staurois parvus]
MMIICQHPVIAEYLRWGRDLSCTLLCMVVQSRAIQSRLLTVKHTHSPHSETAHS